MMSVSELAQLLKKHDIPVVEYLEPNHDGDSQVTINSTISVSFFEFEEFFFIVEEDEEGFSFSDTIKDPGELITQLKSKLPVATPC